MRTSWGRPLKVRLGRPQDDRLVHPRDGQIGSLGELEWEVLGTSWGLIFAS